MCNQTKTAKVVADGGSGLPTFTREKISKRSDLVVVGDQVYDAARFRWAHPGGAQFVSAFGGRDATMAFQTYHMRRFPHKEMQKYLVGTLDASETPVEHDEEHLQISKAVRDALRKQRRGSGFAPALQWAKALAIMGATAYLETRMLLTGDRPWALAALLGFLYALIGLNVQHDANHGAMSRSGWVNTLFGLMQDYIGGSGVMWIQQHVVLHHIFTNDVHMDPDADGFPAIRFHAGAAQGGKAPATASWFPWHLFQHVYIFALEIGYGFVPLVASVGELLFWKHRGYAKFALSPLLLPWGVLSLALHALFYVRFFYLPIAWGNDAWQVSLAKVLLTAAVGGGYLAFFFALSHNFEGAGNFEGGKADGSVAYAEGAEEDNFVRRQVASSSNVCGAKLATVNGGLNYQIEHHLFPRVAHSNYPLIAPVVRAQLEERGIKYTHFNSVFANVRSMCTRLYDLGHPGHGKVE